MINIPCWREKSEAMISFVEVLMPHYCVMAWWNMFDKIILFVGFDWDPVDEDVSLACLILDPI